MIAREGDSQMNAALPRPDLLSEQRREVRPKRQRDDEPQDRDDNRKRQTARHHREVKDEDVRDDRAQRDDRERTYRFASSMRPAISWTPDVNHT
jgi:hypothetical protein